jgi:trehalose-phosphatase
MSRDVFEAIPEIGDRICHAPFCLVCLDLSGSLEQELCCPETVLAHHHLKRVLTSLVKRQGASVALISGKDRGELHKCFGIRGMIYLGSHGLEISGPGQIFVEPTAIEKSTELTDLGNLLASKLEAIPEASVENKGLTLRVSFDKVSAENAEPLRHIVHTALAASNHPFQLTIGTGFFDIRPRVHWDKGAAIGLVKEQIGQPDPLVIYLGQNVAGENSFAGFADAVTVQIGGGPDSMAQFQIDHADRLTDFLDWLDGFLQEQEHRLTDERKHHSMV